MKQLRVAALCVAMGLVASGSRAADFSAALNDGSTPVAHLLVPTPLHVRTSIMVVSADAAGSPSSWCTFKANIVPGPGVPGSFEIVAGASGFDRQLPASIPQSGLTCAPPPNSATNLTIEANQ